MSDSESEGFQPIHSDDDEANQHHQQHQIQQQQIQQIPMRSGQSNLRTATTTAISVHRQPVPTDTTRIHNHHHQHQHHASSSASPPNSDDVPLADRAAAKRSLPPPLALIKRPRNTTTTTTTTTTQQQQQQHHHHHHHHTHAHQTQLPMTKFVVNVPLSQDDEVQSELRRDCDRFEAFAFESPSLSSSSIASIRGNSKKRLAPPSLAVLQPPPTPTPMPPPVPPPSPMLTHDDAIDGRQADFVHIDQLFVPGSSAANSSTGSDRRAVAPPPTPIAADDFVNDELCLALLDALTPFVDPFDFSSDITDIETDDEPPAFRTAAPAFVDTWMLQLDDDTVAAERPRALRDVHDRLACAEPVGVFAAFGQALGRAASD
jgi:hypothetical protein